MVGVRLVQASVGYVCPRRLSWGGSSGAAGEGLFVSGGGYGGVVGQRCATDGLEAVELLYRRKANCTPWGRSERQEAAREAQRFRESSIRIVVDYILHCLLVHELSRSRNGLHVSWLPEELLANLPAEGRPIHRRTTPRRHPPPRSIAHMQPSSLASIGLRLSRLSLASARPALAPHNISTLLRESNPPCDPLKVLR